MTKTLIWFRRDLRTYDNKALYSTSGAVLPIFIFDTDILCNLEKEDKRISYIFDALKTLKKELQARGLNLALFLGKPSEVISYLRTFGFSKISCSYDNDSYAKKRDSEIARLIELERHNDAFIFEKDEIKNNQNLPYRVFTPYYKASLKILNESHYAKIIDKEKSLVKFDFEHILKVDGEMISKMPITLSSIGFQQIELPKFAKRSSSEIFSELEKKLPYYQEERDFPAVDGTAKIGVNLRFGTLSIREVLRRLKIWQEEGIKVAPFYRELIWREFYNSILCHFPKSEWENFLNLSIAYQNREEYIKAWQEGMTGIPLVDAGIRELNETGYMHNRVRMVSASFLTKNLLCDWRIGEAYFAKKLLDYEACSNVGSWQWSAGTGVDTQPFFRIFNPYLQAKRFDGESKYIKRWIPELRDIDSRIINDEQKLMSTTGTRYPKAIVDIKGSVALAKALNHRERLQ